jgi:hypothetical protein
MPEEPNKESRLKNQRIVSEEPCLKNQRTVSEEPKEPHLKNLKNYQGTAPEEFKEPRLKNLRMRTRRI